MTQATPYTRTTGFADDERNNAGGRASVRTAQVDAELDAISVPLDLTISNLAILQRDDGQLRDGIVPISALGADTLKLLATGSAVPRGAWVTATAYAVKDLVTQSGNTYICAVAHTSGVFATDLAAVKWVLFQIGANPAAASIPFSPTANILSATVQAAVVEVDTNARAQTTALADVVTAAKGAGLVGFGVAVTYAAGTVGAFLRRMFSTTAGDGADLISGVGRVCDTIAAVQALAVAKADGGAQRAFALGYSVAGGSGGGQFYYDAADISTAANGGTVFLSTSGGTGRWKRVVNGEFFATWFGAKHDGTTNDQPAYQAMVNAVTNPLQQTCRGGSGAIKLGATLTLPAGVSLKFDGKARTTVIYAGGITGSGTEYSMFKMNNGCRLQDLQISYPTQITSGTSIKAFPPTITGATSVVGASAGGASYIDIQGIRFSGAYIGVQFGDPAYGTVGCGNINIDDIDGMPMYRGIVLDGANDIVHVTRLVFNTNLFGAAYANNTLGVVATTAIGLDIYACDGGKFDKPEVYGYKSGLRSQNNVLGKGPQFTTLIDPTFELCSVPLDIVNQTNQFEVFAGTLTFQNAEANIGGFISPYTGCNLGSGDTSHYCNIAFYGTTFRSIPGSAATVKTNVQFVGCKVDVFNQLSGTTLGAIMVGANNVDLQWMGGMIDGTSRATSRCISNQGAFTGVTMSVGGGVNFKDFAADYTIYQPSKTLRVGQLTNAGSIFYNGIVVTLNNQNSMVVTATPAAGTWALDDIFELAGSSARKRCSVAGTPGTWV